MKTAAPALMRTKNNIAQSQTTEQQRAARGNISSTETSVKFDSCACGGGCPKCLGNIGIQAKLKIGAPNDVYEQEADRVADQVMRMTEPKVQKTSQANTNSNGTNTRLLVSKADVPIQRQEEPEQEDEGEELIQLRALNQPQRQQETDLDEAEEEDLLQAKATPGHTPQVTPNVAANIQNLRGGGLPLPPNQRHFFEFRMGQDFSGVRIHTDSKAADTAQTIQAKAFTLGNNIVFNTGQYSHDNQEGKKLLAHELTHVVQQNDGASMGLQRAPTPFSPQPLAKHFTPRDPQEGSMLSRSAPNTLPPKIARFSGGIIVVVYFSQDSGILDLANYEAVQDLGAELAFMPQSIARVDGHASEEGSEERNLDLSKIRREAVVGVLRSSTKLVPFDLLGQGHGEASPALEETESGVELERQRAENRRVVIHISRTVALAAAKPSDPIDFFPAEVLEEIALNTPTEKKGKREETASAVPNCSASSHAFDRQPPALQAVLDSSFKSGQIQFDKWSPQHRLVLAQIYNRLCSFGLWSHVTRIKKIELGEKGLFGVLEVPGSTGSAYFTSKNRAELLHQLIVRGRFCIDAPLGGSQHPDQVSMREISTLDSLHMSLGPGDDFDAHVDRHSSAGGIDKGQCRYSVLGTAAHLGRELVPEKVRKGFRIPGIQVFPEQGAQPAGDSNALAPGEDAPPLIIGMTVRGSSERKNRGPTSSVAPIEIPTPVLKAIRLLIREDALVPATVGRRLLAAEEGLDFAGPFEEERLARAADQARAVRDSYNNAHKVVIRLIIAMIEANQREQDTVSLKLSANYNKVRQKAALFSEIKRISEIARNLMGDDAPDVRYVKLFFGSKAITTITLRDRSRRDTTFR